MSKVDMFLALDGSRQGAIQGESQVAGHAGEIEVLSWSWGMSQQVHSASQLASKASVRTLNVQKAIDSSSTAIMSALKSAELLGKVVLTCRDPGGIATIDYLRITLRKARICDYEISGGGNEGRQVVESFSIAFKEIEVVYTPKSAANLKSGACTYIDVYE
ncbi:type VI secretion system secreted protein Hcp [Limnobacter thiooxidans]|uniref:Type VI secretion system receptor/chaperone Hcp n=1 Tax=Limnobacter thiooxidans TaxID=131080 RepID=A0AA86MDH0_9BURK|nr:type VI secretion system secreted protein Hcp [Limnobacter thiooxidans]BET24625.1 type VI secretion system receptor/chaperone Hcp [Limnobacter thiooxidans]